MDKHAHSLGLSLGAFTGALIVWFLIGRNSLGISSETVKPRRQPTGPIIVLKFALFVPFAILLSMMLTSLEIALIIAAGSMMAGTFFTPPYGTETFRFEEHPWVNLVGFPFFFFCLSTILYFGSRRILGKGSVKAKWKLILGLCLLG